jgi:hypothetical protein
LDTGVQFGDVSLLQWHWLAVQEIWKMGMTSLANDVAVVSPEKRV